MVVSFQPLLDFSSFEYNSQDSFDTDEDDDYTYDEDDTASDADTNLPPVDDSHLNQMSYSWRLMNLCILKIVLDGIMSFLTAAGLEVSGKILCVEALCIDWISFVI